MVRTAALTANPTVLSHLPTSIPLRHMPRPEHIPLAPAQERMWYAAEAGRSSDWNVVRAYRIRDVSVDTTALAVAIADVVARHAPLRTRYPATAHGPAQDVSSAHTGSPDVRVSMATESTVGSEITELGCQEFDLAVDLPLRARIWVLGPRDVVLALVVHHVALDGHATGVLLRDLMAAYAARSTGHAPDWAPLPVDYIDYTLWKHAQLGSHEDKCSLATQQLHYWTKTLAFRRCPLEFPYDRPRSTTPDTTGDTISVAFDSATHSNLADRAHRAGSSLFMLLQAAFALCVGAFANRSDVTVATAVSGRDDPLLDDLVGNLADDVMMRIRLHHASDIDELLDQVRTVALAAFAHPDTPDQLLKRHLMQDPEHPLFQATLILQRATADNGLTSPHITEIPAGVVRAKHDLEFGLTELYRPTGEPVGVTGSFIYPTARFDRATAQSFVAGFTAVVELLADGYRGPLRPLVTVAVGSRP